MPVRPTTTPARLCLNCLSTVSPALAASASQTLEMEYSRDASSDASSPSCAPAPANRPVQGGGKGPRVAGWPHKGKVLHAHPRTRTRAAPGARKLQVQQNRSTLAEDCGSDTRGRHNCPGTPSSTVHHFVEIPHGSRLQGGSAQPTAGRSQLTELLLHPVKGRVATRRTHHAPVRWQHAKVKAATGTHAWAGFLLLFCIFPAGSRTSRTQAVPVQPRAPGLPTLARPRGCALRPVLNRGGEVWGSM